MAGEFERLASNPKGSPLAPLHPRRGAFPSLGTPEGVATRQQKHTGNLEKMPQTERDHRFDELKDEFEDMKARDRATRPHPSQRNPEGFCLGDRANRYPDIIPSDKPHKGRFVLARPAVVNGYYYFNGTWYDEKYLATQGPLPETVEEFWRVVYDNRITVILMLTRLVENCKPKCVNYWFGARDDGCHWLLSNGLVVWCGLRRLLR